jgi:hypothetical protein
MSQPFHFLTEELHLPLKLGIGFHFVFNKFHGVKYGGMASVYLFCNGLQGLPGMMPAKVNKDVAGVGVFLFAGF